MTDINVDEFFGNIPPPGEGLDDEPAPAEPSPEPESEPEEEPELEPAAEERTRDEKGRFVADEDVLTKRLRDKEEFIGRQSTEIGELRKQIEDLAASVQAPQQDLSSVEEQVAQNPQLAQQYAVLALQQGDQLAYEKILRTWAEYDQFGAILFAQRAQALQTQAELDARYRPQLETAQQFAARQSVEQATREVAAKYPDLPAVLGQIDPDDPDTKIPSGILRDLADPATAAEGTEALYFWAKGRFGDVSAAATAEATAEHKENARAAKTQASVAATSSHSEDTGGKHHHNWGDEVPEDVQNFYDFLVTDPLTKKPIGQ